MRLIVRAVLYGKRGSSEVSLWEDQNGNGWPSAQYTEEQAIELSKTLFQCTNCINCMNCTNCVSCLNCTNCSHCSICIGVDDCYDCQGCYNCRDCQLCESCDNCSQCYCSDQSVGCRSCDNCQGCVTCINCKSGINLTDVKFPVLTLAEHLNVVSDAKADENEADENEVNLSAFEKWFLRRLKQYKNLPQFEKWFWRKVAVTWNLSWFGVLLILALVHAILKGLMYGLKKLSDGVRWLEDWVAYNPLAFDKKPVAKKYGDSK